MNGFSQMALNLNNQFDVNAGVHCSNTAIFNLFARNLFQRAMSVFKPSAPDGWNPDYFMPLLFSGGYFGIINTDRYGVIPQWCTLSGYDVQFQPARALFSNPLFRDSYDLTIGQQCVIIHLFPDYEGIVDTVYYHANMLALAAESAHINLFNSHLAYVFASKNKTAAATFAEMYSAIGRGEPYTIVDNDLMDRDGNPKWIKFDMDLAKNYITTELLQDMRVIITMFDEEVGIPSNNNPKKERMLVDEVNSNNQSTYTRMQAALERVKDGCKQARDMFGIELDFNWRYQPDLGGGEKDVQQRGAADNKGAV